MTNGFTGRNTSTRRVLNNDDETAARVLARLDDHIRTRPHLAERIYRELLMELHRSGIATIDDVDDEAQCRAGECRLINLSDPNQAERERLDEREREQVQLITREYVGRHFCIADIDDLVNLALKREEVHSLETIANLGNMSYRELVDKIQRFCQLPLGETRLAPAEVVGTRVALIRHLISDQLEFIGIAKNHLRIRDFEHITQRIIGSETGMGRIGGKAGGMTLANRVLAAAGEDDENLPFPVAVPDSYFLRSDVIGDFLRLNRLDEYHAQKYKPVDQLEREYPLIRGLFRNGDFPLRIVHELRRVLKNLGTSPLIVRSSSLLEDRLGTAFCGKYASIFVANQGTLEQRLSALLGAIAEVYASTLGPDPIVYRREHNLLDYVEEMAVLIQKVVGVRVGDFFLPAFGGVAFSRNEYRWSPRIKREDGMARVVIGLGTRAVDRGGTEYPRMIALGAPTLRPESNVQEILRSAQRTVDAIDLRTNRLTAVKLSEILSRGAEFPMLDKLVSIYRDGELYPPMGLHVNEDPSRICVTFDKLIRDTPFVERIRGLVRRLEQVYEMPVDLEFACDGKHLFVLQCRTQSQARDAGPVTVPEDIPAADVVFDAHKFVRSGLIEGIEHVVYVDPATYDTVANRQERVEIARTIGRLNHTLKPRTFILVGPGRWGSNDILLGVPVRYADINHCRMLVEVARRKNGFSPEVSFGTHFFQDLVEADIRYLPLYPDEEGNRFNPAFLRDTPNALAQILPDEKGLADRIRVIHVPAVSGGRTLTIAMDGETDHAVAYLAPATAGQPVG